VEPDGTPSVASTPAGPPVAVEAGPASRISTRVRVVLGSATLVMLGLSWPLWVEPSDLPRVPFLMSFPEASAPLVVAAVRAAPSLDRGDRGGDRLAPRRSG
jgi:hypothetical protein